ncbi:MAG: YHS domain-containing (seleno)protein [Cyanobacteria bacterium J06639_16]
MPVTSFFKYTVLGLCLITISGCTSHQKSKLAVAPNTSEIQVITPIDSEATPSKYALNRDELGRALRGYDPVAYFEDGQAIPGKEAYKLEWQEAIWSFSSSDNRDTFASNPERYAPANGGYCTFGIVLSKKFDGDPQIWLIHEQKLYVFLNSDVKTTFLQDELGNFNRVSNNWPLIKDKSPEAL